MFGRVATRLTRRGQLREMHRWTTAEATEFSSSAKSHVMAVSSLLSFSTPEVLQPGSVVINLGAETEMGQVVTAAAAMRGLTTINVVSQDKANGYPDSVSHVYELGGDYVVTESFMGFRGFKELVTEVCEESGLGESPALVIDGSTSLVGTGTSALEAFAKAKTYTAKKSLVEDMQDNNTLLLANRVAGLGAAVAKNTAMVKHVGYPTKGTPEQTELAKEMAEDLSSMLED